MTIRNEAVVVVPTSLIGGTTVSFLDLPWVSILIAAALAGAVGLAGAANKSIHDSKNITLLYALSSVATGTVAGIIIFLLTSWQEVDSRIALVAVILSGWSGKYVMDEGKTEILKKILKIT